MGHEKRPTAAYLVNERGVHLGLHPELARELALGDSALAVPIRFGTARACVLTWDARLMAELERRGTRIGGPAPADHGPEALAARVKLQQAAGAVEQLKALGTFKRSQADVVLQKLIPGWAGFKGRTLQRRTPEWLAEHGFVSEGDGAGRTYRFDGK